MGKWLRYMNAAGFAAVIIANYIAQTKGMVDQTVGEVSAKYPTVMTPASYAFSIWLLIYAGLASFAVYGFTAKGKQEQLVESVSIYFAVSCLLNIAWLVLWLMEAIVSSAFMLYALFLCLLLIMINLNKVIPVPTTISSRLFVMFPFSIYTAWIAVASLVNTAALLTYSAWRPLSAEALAIVLLALATLLAYLLGFAFRNVVMMLVFIWALISIAIEQRNHFWLAGLALAAAIVVSVGMLVLVLRLWSEHKPTARA